MKQFGLIVWGIILSSLSLPVGVILSTVFKHEFGLILSTIILIFIGIYQYRLKTLKRRSIGIGLLIGSFFTIILVAIIMILSRLH